MATINTLAEFRDYIRRQLGSPVICVEIDNTQLDDIICDTIALANRYLYGEGIYQDYLGFTVSAGVSAYDLSTVSGDVIEDVIDFDMSNQNGSMNSLFSLTNFAAADIFRGFGWGQGGYYNYGQGMGLSQYQTTLIYAEEMKLLLGEPFRADFTPTTQTLRLVPSPTKNGMGLLSVYRKTAMEKMYNHIIIKKLATATAKKLWATNLKKYVLELPGGGQINGESLYADGVVEEERWLERLESEAEPAVFFVG